MPRRPQRAGNWSLRQVALAAGTSIATARSAVRDGHLTVGDLTAHDTVVLRAACMLPSLRPVGELREANRARTVPAREREAVARLRAALELGLPRQAVLVIDEDGAEVLDSVERSIGAAQLLLSRGVPYLALPVGAWASELLGAPQQQAA